MCFTDRVRALYCYRSIKQQWLHTRSNMAATMFGSGTAPGWEAFIKNRNRIKPSRSASTSTGRRSISRETISTVGEPFSGIEDDDELISFLPDFIGNTSSNLFLFFSLKSFFLRLIWDIEVSPVSSRLSSSLSYVWPKTRCFRHAPRLKI